MTGFARAAALLAAPLLVQCQTPRIAAMPEEQLREFAGAYQWDSRTLVYLQLWNEFSGKNELVAFDESGEVRTLYPAGADRFFAGPGAAVRSAEESRVEFQRDGSGRIVSLAWRRADGSVRTARRVNTEQREDVRFTNGDVRLAGTLITPTSTVSRSSRSRLPAVILVHGSGPGTREAILPFARFLIRHGVAVLGYDKRGVGGSTGDWNTASFHDLAGDVEAAFQYLKTRADIDTTRIGLLGVSQAGWVMPLAATRARNIAFVISISGPGVPAAETTIDHARSEMLANGMKAETVERIINVMELQYEYARTGGGWDAYTSALRELTARFGRPPANFPTTKDDPYWAFARRLYFYDPAPTLRQLRVPTLAIFGELDNNVLAEKNKAAWGAALRAAGNDDHVLLVLPRANHIMLEATVGNNAEMASLSRFVPAYFSTVLRWLEPRLSGSNRD